MKKDYSPLLRGLLGGFLFVLGIWAGFHLDSEECPTYSREKAEEFIAMAGNYYNGTSWFLTPGGIGQNYLPPEYLQQNLSVRQAIELYWDWSHRKTAHYMISEVCR